MLTAGGRTKCRGALFQTLQFRRIVITLLSKFKEHKCLVYRQFFYQFQFLNLWNFIKDRLPPVQLCQVDKCATLPTSPTGVWIFREASATLLEVNRSSLSSLGRKFCTFYDEAIGLMSLGWGEYSFRFPWEWVFSDTFLGLLI